MNEWERFCAKHDVWRMTGDKIRAAAARWESEHELNEQDREILRVCVEIASRSLMARALHRK